jgi:hypothetical protein
MKIAQKTEAALANMFLRQGGFGCVNLGCEGVSGL